LTNLRWDNVDFDRGLISVQNTRGWSTKSRKNRVVGVTEKGIELLRQARIASDGHEYVLVTKEGTQWRNNLRRDFRVIVKRARIPPCTIHDLRRTFCTEMSKVVPPKDVQQLAGCYFPNKRNMTCPPARPPARPPAGRRIEEGGSQEETKRVSV
jgi:integrase